MEEMGVPPHIMKLINKEDMIHTGYFLRAALKLAPSNTGAPLFSSQKPLAALKIFFLGPAIKNLCRPLGHFFN